MKNAKIVKTILLISIVISSGAIFGGFYYFLPQDFGEVEISIQIRSKKDNSDVVFQSTYIFNLEFSRFSILKKNLLNNFSIPIPKNWSTVECELLIKNFYSIKGNLIYIAVYMDRNLDLTWGGLTMKSDSFQSIYWAEIITIEVWNQNAGPDPEFSSE